MLDALEASGVVARDEVEELRGKVGDKYNASLSANERQRQIDQAHGVDTPGRFYKFRRADGVQVSTPDLPSPEPMRYTAVEPSGAQVHVRNTARVDPNPPDIGLVPNPHRVEAIEGGAIARPLVPRLGVDPGQYEGSLQAGQPVIRALRPVGQAAQRIRRKQGR